MVSLRKVCIIGAGSSGIAAAKSLHEIGIPFDCFEKGSGIGGNWRFMNDNGLSSSYETLHINSSKERMAYSDFPMPDDCPVFPHHSDILKYFENYVDHFGFRENISFNSEVKAAVPTSNGEWKVTLADGQVNFYRALLVANGHHWNPKTPVFPGTFTGQQFHSHEYKSSKGLEGRRVLVVGVGNSGVDIACESTHFSDKTFLSTRRSAYIIPKFLLGRPTDQWLDRFFTSLPLKMQEIGYHILIRLGPGDQRFYGMPKPKHSPIAEHPTQSSELLNAVAHGKVKVKSNIKKFESKQVFFEDGSSEEIDLIIYATGYKVSFPFFDSSLMFADNNNFPLYKRVVHAGLSNLYFIGLLQPLGGIMPLSEIQSKWVASILSGECVLPEKTFMHNDIDRDQKKMKSRYTKSTRHTLQVDWFPYIDIIRHEMKRYRKGRIVGNLLNLGKAKSSASPSIQ
jgi:dimethylaniline monooxygenase (N-oxide forming)